RAVVGAQGDDLPGVANAGSAYVFDRQSNGTWAEVGKLTASDAATFDGFGSSVCVRGDRALVGAPFHASLLFNAGAAYVFERQSTGVWLEVAKLEASDASSSAAFGASVSLSGDRALVGQEFEDTPTINNAGSAYVFDRQFDGTWLETGKLQASDAGTNSFFGASVALSGGRAAIGAPNHAHLDDPQGKTGAAYVFEENLFGLWDEVARLEGDDSNGGGFFGTSVDLDGDRALVGAPQDSTIAGASTGSAFVFERTPEGQWVRGAELYPGGGAAGDRFGTSVAISGGRALVGLPGDGADVGAADVFRLCDGCLAAYGTGTPGCAGKQILGSSASPTIGNASFALVCDDAPASSLGLGLLTDVADLAGSDPFGLGVLLHVDLLFSTLILPTDFISAMPGVATSAVPIPNAPNLVGATIHAQALWSWGSACSLPPFGLSTSSGLSFTILAP
ncbi:MAG TPA: FG-GAP repeat protein, partial [Planctomycetota bacterium]|nr:FG-GAP repeat protein [Planctomycetota bacterium]